jgi:hypothetical protein
MARKTINVDELRDKTNEMLAKSTCSPDVRQGTIDILEYVLHETGNYKGFRYLTEREVPDMHLPGVRYDGNNILPFQSGLISPIPPVCHITELFFQFKHA